MNEPIDYKILLIELIQRMTEEDLVRMVVRSERNVGHQTPLSNYLRAEIKKRRTLV